jgi:hypothetical protein
MGEHKDPKQAKEETDKLHDTLRKLPTYDPKTKASEYTKKPKG